MSKKKHGGHHGGAWKVAYADFVTAMMALFLVLWLTSQDTKIKKAVERSFRNPFATLTKQSTGLMPNEDAPKVNARQGNFDSAAAVELTFLRKISEELLKKIKSEDDEEEGMKVEVTSEGMRINVFDRAKKPIFMPDSAQFTEHGAWLFTTIAWVVSESTNMFQVELEGHTESGRKPKSDDYGPWELSTDRANAARRKLLDNGIESSQIRKVAGFADTMPLDNFSAADERNRRVTVMLRVRSGSR
jgi:chemotaxis protein MotB